MAPGSKPGVQPQPSRSVTSPLEGRRAPDPLSVVEAEHDSADGSRSRSSEDSPPIAGDSRLDGDRGEEGTAGSELFRVVDELTREPLEGARVWVIAAGRQTSGRATSDANGFFRVERPPASSLRISCSGYSTLLNVADGLTVASRGASYVEIALRPMSILHGQLGSGSRFDVARFGLSQLPMRVRIEAEGLGFRQVGEPFGSVLVVAGNGRLARSDRGSGVDESWHGAEATGVHRPTRPDGSWEVAIAVPYGEDALRDLSIFQIGSAGQRRLLGHVEKLDPGEVRAVPDQWEREQPLRVSLQSDDLAQMAAWRRIYLWRDGFRAGVEDPELALRFDAEGSVTIPQLPRGTWNFMIEIPELPKDISPRGRFWREAGVEELTLELECEVRRIVISSGVAVPAFIGVARPGERCVYARRARDGDEVIWPLPTDGRHLDLVVFRKSSSGVGSEVQEIQRQELTASEEAVEVHLSD
ncbi:MAG: carboxypeptidase-like regulatory domain-containing protein [Planctomycetota bacterium]